MYAFTVMYKVDSSLSHYYQYFPNLLRENEIYPIL